MTDPRRLIEEGTSALGVHCLRAAQAERPPHASKLRTLAAIGLTGAGSTLSSVAAGSAAGFFNKWLLLGCIGSGSLLGAFAFGSARHAPSPPAAPAQRESATSVVASDRPSTQPAPEPAAPAALASLPVPSPTETPRPRPLASARAGSLSAETAALDLARRDWQRRDYAAALARLDTYQSSFPKGVLLPEAGALRVQILHALGRQAEADEKARVFLQQHPESPLGDRVRSARSAAPAVPPVSEKRP